MTITPPLSERTPEQLRAHVAEVLTRSRERSTALTDAVDDDDLVRQHSTADVAAGLGPRPHRQPGGAVAGPRRGCPRAGPPGHRRAVRRVQAQPRQTVPSLPLLSPPEARAYVREVRDKVLDVLDHAPLEGRRLVEHAFAFGMVAQHEQQHAETMLATHQLRQGDAVLTAPPPPRATVRPRAAEVLVPGGPFTMGTSTEPWALDNERPAHQVARGRRSSSTPPR